jgi:hypothetical protein
VSSDQERENALFRAWDEGFMAGQRAMHLGGPDEEYPKNPHEWHAIPRPAPRESS